MLLTNVAQTEMGGGPQPLTVRELAPLMALPTPSMDRKVEDVERRLKVNQLRIQETMIKQI